MISKQSISRWKGKVTKAEGARRGGGARARWERFSNQCTSVYSACDNRRRKSWKRLKKKSEKHKRHRVTDNWCNPRASDAAIMPSAVSMKIRSHHFCDGISCMHTDFPISHHLLRERIDVTPRYRFGKLLRCALLIPSEIPEEKNRSRLRRLGQRTKQKRNEENGNNDVDQSADNTELPSKFRMKLSRFDVNSNIARSRSSWTVHRSLFFVFFIRMLSAFSSATKHSFKRWWL